MSKQQEPEEKMIFYTIFNILVEKPQKGIKQWNDTSYSNWCSTNGYIHSYMNIRIERNDLLLMHGFPFSSLWDMHAATENKTKNSRKKWQLFP